MARRVVVVSALVLSVAANARAQSGYSGTFAAQNPPAPSSATPNTTYATGPATTTFYGDTGLWYVPTAEVLAHGKWSVSGYRRGTNYLQGSSKVADFARTSARSSSTTRRSAASSIAIRASTRRGPALTSATSTSAAR